MVPTGMGYLMGKTKTYLTYVTHSGPPRAFNLLDSSISTFSSKHCPASEVGLRNFWFGQVQYK